MLTTSEGELVVALGQRTSLGRHPDNTVQLLDKIVSKEHCIVEERGSTFFLCDLGSLNGTFIGGQRLHGERPLMDGDEFTLGSTRARFVANGNAPLDADGPVEQPGSEPRHSHVEPILRGAEPNDSQAPVAPVAPVAAPRPGPSLTPAAASRQAASRAPSPKIVEQEEAVEIGAQVAAKDEGFRPFDEIAGDARQIARDYERLRLSHQLSQAIALEPDLDRLLAKVLASVFQFVAADRGAIFLRGEDGELSARATRRRDGTDAAIKVSSTIMNHVMRERASVLTHDAALDFAQSRGHSMVLNRIGSAMVAPLLHEDELLGVLWLDNPMIAQFQKKDLELVTVIARQAAMFIQLNILAKKIEEETLRRERFSRLLSPNVAERVLSGMLEVKQGGELVERCTVFNSDIRGFTSLSETTRPEALVELLNDYFEQMTDTVFKHEGTLDKYMGDGLMAVWGAPVATEDGAVRAVTCALEQMALLGQLNRRRVAGGEPPLAIGIGIHTGPLVAGCIGSSKALSYTVIGDTANTSARLCGAAKTGQILVSEATLAALGGAFLYEELPPADLKGKSKPFRVFNITERRAATG